MWSVPASRLQHLCLCAGLCLAFAGCTTRGRTLRHAQELERTQHCESALAAYQKVLPHFAAREAHERSAVYAGMGNCLIKLGHPGEALEVLQRALGLNPENDDAHQHLAELYLAAGLTDGAREHVDFLTRKQPESATTLLLQGMMFAAEGNTERAKKTLSRALAADPTRDGTAEALASLYDRDNEVEAARAVLQRVAKAQSGNPKASLALARLEEREANIAAAETAYREAVRIQDSAETNTRLAEFLARNSRMGEAEQVLARVDAMQPQSPVALPDFEITSGRSSDALRDYQSAFASAQAATDPARRTTLAARLVEADLQGSGGPHGARLHLARLRQWLSPGSAALLEAEITLAEGDMLGAKRHAEEAERLDDSPAAHYLLGAITYRQHANAEALKQWQAALDADPGYVPALIAMATYTFDRGHPEDAEGYILSVVRSEPANFDALMLYARVLTDRERYDAAIAISRRAIAARPDAPDPHVVLGEVALKQAKAAEALLEFEKAVALDGRASRAYSGLTRVFRAGVIDRAMLRKMEETAEKTPISPSLFEIAGRLYADHGWNQDALRCLRRANEAAAIKASTAALAGASDPAANRGDDTLHLLAGSDAQDSNALHDAEREYLSAIDDGDTSGIAANNLAWIYAQRQASLDRALSLARQALAARPHDAAVLDTLGYVHLRRREYSQALDYFTQASHSLQSGTPDSAELKAQLGEHLAEAKRLAGQPESLPTLPSR